MVQSIQYEVVEKKGKVEIRRYPKIVIAKTSNLEPDNFGVLFRFISGNTGRKKK
jgi:hypothetical protein